MPRIQYPSIDLVRQCLRYEDGKLYWLERSPSTFKDPSYAPRVNKRCSGKEAGCMSEYTDKQGKLHRRWCIRIFDIKLYRYQIVWALFNNEWIGKNSLDHIDRDSTDDRIENLRPASQKDQAGNCGKRSHNTTGYKGVIYIKSRGKYYAQMTISENGKGKHIYVGSFNTPEEAHEAYCKRAKNYFGEFFHDGKDDSPS